ncbi:MAG TPA: ATP synthase F1 subunit gamma [Candidatus Limnocylindrales bacterium]|nr:ATP synthase F1 subunit gamma [Candidatus Limnocylindrales bacterium]
MPSTRDIRRRIRSVKNTAQITKAMQMVAAAKMRKAQQAALAGRPYAALMNEVLARAAARTAVFKHPLMEARPVRKRAVILVSTDRGLCGALNSNLFREAAKFDQSNTVFISAGRKAAQFVARVRRPLTAEFTYKDAPQFGEARAVSKFAQDIFLKGEVDAVDILFTNFISTLTQQPKVVPFLPIGKIEAVKAGHGDAPKPEPLSPTVTTEVFEFEPDETTVLGALLPHSLSFRIYQILLEARASEHSARMVAMKNATDNAQQLIKGLTLEYNKLRQSNITKELLEIATAQMAVG